MRNWLAFALVLAGGLVVGAALVLELLSRIVPQEIGGETKDRLVWLVGLLSVPIALVIMFTRQRYNARGALRTPSWLIVGSLAILAVSVVTLTQVPGIPADLQTSWWLGFGPNVLIISVVAGFTLVFFKVRNGFIVSRVVWTLGLLVGLVWVLPSFINVPWTYDVFHAPQVLNDTLALYAGRFPLSDYIPQYSVVLGWPVAVVFPLIDGFLGPQHLTIMLSLFLSLLGLASAGLAVYVGFRLLPKASKALAPLLVLPLFVHVSGSVSATPARLLLPLVAFALLIGISDQAGKFRFFSLGVVLGLCLLNNPEIGAVTVLSAIGGLVVAGVKGRLAHLLYLGIGTAAPVFAYSAYGYITGNPIDLSQIAAYARAFSGGYYSLPMPTFGTYLLVLMVGAGATILGVVASRFVVRNEDRVAAVGAVFAGLFVLGSFAYYVGRSSSSGQLQFLLPLTALSIAALVGLVGIPSFSRGKGESKATSYQQVVRDMLMLSLPAVAIAAVVQMPALAKSWNALLPNSSVLSAPLAEAEAVESLTALGETESVSSAVALNHSNLLFLQTGRASALPFTAITDLQISPVFTRLLCQEIVDQSEGVIVPSDMAGQIVEVCPNVMEIEPLSSSLVALKDQS